MECVSSFETASGLCEDRGLARRPAALGKSGASGWENSQAGGCFHIVVSQALLVRGGAVVIFRVLTLAEYSAVPEGIDMTSRRILLLGGAALVAGVVAAGTLVPGPVLASSNLVFVDAAGVAINGYDPVAYFTEGKPVEGSSDFTTEWMGATWHFSSAENRDMFVAAPEDYAPQYGGYCAFAVSYGSTASTVPEAWTVHNGKLYLNFSLGVRDRWRADIDERIALADKNWPGVLN